mgnify:FL=1
MRCTKQEIKSTKVKNLEKSYKFVRIIPRSLFLLPAYAEVAILYIVSKLLNWLAKSTNARSKRPLIFYDQERAKAIRIENRSWVGYIDMW